MKGSGRREKTLIFSGDERGVRSGSGGIQRGMRVFISVGTIVTLAAALSLSGCYGSGPKQNPEELREKTAAATAQLKQDARAVAQGIKEGWSRDRPLDLNRASAKDLASLPGITEHTAERIVANRPYAAPDELVRKRVVTREQYDKIAERITVKKKDGEARGRP